MQAVEASLSKLETSQGDGFRRLSSNLSTALDDAELALQAAVRSETWKSLEPVRQLPQILATMVPPMPVMDIGRQLVSSLRSNGTIYAGFEMCHLIADSSCGGNA